jgi:hypothetical protein
MRRGGSSRSGWRSTGQNAEGAVDAGAGQVGARIIVGTLATLVEYGHLGERRSREARGRAEQERNRATRAVLPAGLLAEVTAWAASCRI